MAFSSKVKKSSLVFLLLGVTILVNAQREVPAAPPSKSGHMGVLKKPVLRLPKGSWDTVAFRNIGPAIMSGRVVDVAVNNADPTEFYVAYATGGLWHTTNNGQSFNPIFDSADVITIGAIAVNWKTRAIWVGTGEVNSSRSSYAGKGVYKSADSGKTWRYIGLPQSHHIGKILLHPTDDNTAWVAVLGHLYSPNKERGVYKTIDGGATWQQTLAINETTGIVDLDINPQNPRELYAAAWQRKRAAWNFEPSGAGSGLYKSDDGGTSWKKISGGTSGFPEGANVGRIGVAVYPKNGQLVYAVLDNQSPKPDTAKKDTATYVLADLKGLSKEQFARLDNKRLDTFLKQREMDSHFTAQLLKQQVATNVIKPTDLYDYLYVNTGFESPPIGCEVYRSENGGQSWRKVNEKEVPIFSTYGYYFSKIYVSPYNPDKVVVLGYSPQVSLDGGKTFKDISKENVHADHHALWIDPARDGHLVNGNDGGINITYDNGAHWFKANTPAVGQFYSVVVDNAKPYNVYGGLQDNGVWWGPSTNKETTDWQNEGNYAFKALLGGADGMQVQVDTTDNATVYGGFQFGNYYRANRLQSPEKSKSIFPWHQMGERPYRFNWQAPILLSRHNASMLYFGGNKLFRSFNKGDTMLVSSPDLTNGDRGGNVPYGTLTAIEESPLRFGLLYAGTDDGNSYVSKDAGFSWINISTPEKGTKLPQHLWVSRITASRYQVGRVYLSLNGYRNDDFKPYLYVSDDYGTTWSALGGDLPDEPINVVREDPKQHNILYVGTDGGLYVSFDRGGHFSQWTAGLPRSVPVHDIAIQARENEIVLATHGRSIYIAKLDAVQKHAN